MEQTKGRPQEKVVHQDIVSQKEIDTVNIFVKWNFDTSRDMKFTIPLKEKVLKIKECVTQQHPLAPPVNSQKLIFSGRVLQDDQLLSEVFKQVLFLILILILIFLSFFLSFEFIVLILNNIVCS